MARMATTFPSFRILGLYLGAWAAIIVACGLQYYALESVAGNHASVGSTLAWSFTGWSGWMLLAPLVVWVTLRWPVDADGWRRHLPIHLVALPLMLVLHAILYASANRLVFGGGEPLAGEWTRVLTSTGPYDSLVYVGLVALVQARRYYRLFRERAVAASQLRAQLAETRLQALSAQIQPHFLFNALNTVAALMRRDVAAASRVMTQLSDLLRMALEHGGGQYAVLRREIEFTERYLAVQQARFRDRLRVELSIAPDTLDLTVPSLILQPLVENAVRHGIEPRAQPGQVAIRSVLEGGHLVLEVTDDGPGLDADGPDRERGDGRANGIGLANTRARLRQLYGSAGRLSLSGGPCGGVVARLELPISPVAPVTP